MPVAVAKLPDGVSKTDLFEKASKLGPRYALAEVYTLDELELESVPTTSLGKVRKSNLQEAIRKFQEHQQQVLEREVSDNQELEIVRDTIHMLVGAWESLTGVRPSTDVSVSDLADSITMLRYCDAVFRSSGKRLYFQDVLHHETLRQQAKLLLTRDSGGELNKSRAAVRKKTTPGLSSSPHHPDEDPHAIPMTKSHTSTSRKRTRHPDDGGLMRLARKYVDGLGFPNSAVEGVLPIRDSLHRMVDGLRPQSFQTQVVFRLSSVSSNQIARGVEKATLARSMLRTALFQQEEGGLYHILLGPSHELWDQLVSVVEVYSDWEAQQRWQDESRQKLPRGLMFKAEIISSRNSESKYLSVLYNHSVMDALSLYSMHRDVDSLIHDANASTTPLTPFKLFSELLTNYESSLPAHDAVSFHVKRLRGISRLQKAFWPTQRAPGWMIMSDIDSSLAAARDRSREIVWNGKWPLRVIQYRRPRIGRVVYLPGLQDLKVWGIPPSMFAKAAIVLFNVLKTGSSHALFNSWECGRSWPFVTPWMEAMMPPAMNVDGPMVEWVLNLVEVFGDEKVVDFLLRMVVEGDQLKRHEHVPWRKVVKALRDEGDLAIDASFRQSFVWDMSLGLSVVNKGKDIFKCLEPVSRSDWADW